MKSGTVLFDLLRKKIIFLIVFFLMCSGITFAAGDERPAFKITSIKVNPVTGGLAYIGYIPESKKMFMVDGREGKQYDGIGGFIFSPDGRRLAYSALDGDGRWFMVVDSKEGKRYTAIGRSYAFSPDSQKLVYFAQRGAKWVMVTDEAEGKEHDRMGGFAFSSDGRRLGYAAMDGDGKWFMVIDGQEEKHYDGIGASSFVFSRDGSRTAYAAKMDKKWVIVVDGKEGRQYDALSEGPYFSLDGKSVSYIARKGTWTMVVDNEETGFHGEETASGMREAINKALKGAPEKMAWENARHVNTPQSYQKYLEDYPTGVFQKEAKKRVESIYQKIIQELARKDSLKIVEEALLDEKRGEDLRKAIVELLCKVDYPQAASKVLLDLLLTVPPKKGDASGGAISIGPTITYESFQYGDSPYRGPSGRTTIREGPRERQSYYQCAVREAAALALWKINPYAGLGVLIKRSSIFKGDEQEYGEYLGRIIRDSAKAMRSELLPRLTGDLEKGSMSAVIILCKVLGLGLKDAESNTVVPVLIGRLEDADADIRDIAKSALSEITGMDYGMDRERWEKWWQKQKR